MADPDPVEALRKLIEAYYRLVEMVEKMSVEILMLSQRVDALELSKNHEP